MPAPFLLGVDNACVWESTVRHVLEAVKRKQATYFISLQRLVADLRKAHHLGRFDRRLVIYLKPRLLILDEVGYLPLDPLDAANLFRLVQERSERGAAIVVASNITFGEWGRFLGDPRSWPRPFWTGCCTTAWSSSVESATGSRTSSRPGSRTRSRRGLPGVGNS